MSPLRQHFCALLTSKPRADARAEDSGRALVESTCPELTDTVYEMTAPTGASRGLGTIAFCGAEAM